MTRGKLNRLEVICWELFDLFGNTNITPTDLDGGYVNTGHSTGEAYGIDSLGEHHVLFEFKHASATIDPKSGQLKFLLSIAKRLSKQSRIVIVRHNAKQGKNNVTRVEPGNVTKWTAFDCGPSFEFPTSPAATGSAVHKNDPHKGPDDVSLEWFMHRWFADHGRQVTP